MINNRSVPENVVLPHVVCRDVGAAISWLERAFGAREHYRYGQGSGMGAQVWVGAALVMLRSAREGEKTPREIGFGTQSLTVFVEDVEARFERAKTAGAVIVEEPHETVYGEFQFAALDLDGHHWLFSRHASDVSPVEWGANVARA